MNIRIALCFFFLSASLGLNAGEIPNAQPPETEQSGNPTPESVLAKQVSEIASSTTLSRREKTRQIANAVRLAVIATTAGVQEADQMLKIAISLATAAAEAAPNFAEVILNTVLSIPSISGIAGAPTKLQAAVSAAAAAADHGGNGTSFTQQHQSQDREFGGGLGDVVVSPSH